ncbi:MAG: hypothetical protein IPG10_07515 [Flavobacteriales bacterium]|nr:hypothetical protein [Flavobacteriales bacterium]
MTRPLLLAMAVLIGLLGTAQVYNGSFENAANDPDLSGWTPVCPCSDPQSSLDVPGGTGIWSVDVTAEDPFDNQCLCVVTYDLVQDIPWLTPGSSTLSYWTKGHGGNGPPATVKVAYYSMGSAPSLTTPWGEGDYDTVWTYHEDPFYWDGVFPSSDSLFVLIAAGAASGGALHANFDAIEIISLSTAIGVGLPTERPAFRPNPVQDRIWIDLHEPPSSVELIDALGRTTPLGFIHAAGTLEVDLNSAAPGMCMLLLRSGDGMRIVRFLKN